MTSLPTWSFSFQKECHEEEESLNYELTLKLSPGRLTLFAIIREGLKGILIFFEFLYPLFADHRDGTDSFLLPPIVCINENLMHSFLCPYEKDSEECDLMDLRLKKN